MNTFIPLYTIPWALKWTAVSIQLLATLTSSTPPNVRAGVILFAQQQIQYDQIAYQEAQPKEWVVIHETLNNGQWQQDY